MRKIKFRGQSIETDAIVYGWLVVYENHHYTHWIITPGIEPNVPVKPESVAQLIGVDSNEQEVYEGDKVIRIAGEDNEAEKIFSMTIADFAGIRDEEEEPFQATFEDFAAIRDGEIVKCAK